MKTSRNAWDKIYKNKGHYFEGLHPDIDLFLKILGKMKLNKVLDLGSGSGRHTVYLASKGLNVSGVDISPTGIKLTKNWLKKENLKADLLIQDIMKPLPYSDNSFDAIISIQVIHHAKKETVKNVIKEINRVLKHNGIIFISVPLNKRYDPRRKGWKMKMIAERTYLPLDGQEKGLIHYFFTKSEFIKSFPKFKILKAYMDKTNHFVIIATKK